MYFDPDDWDPLNAEIATLPVEMQRRIFAVNSAANLLAAETRLQPIRPTSDELCSELIARARRIESELRKGELADLPYPEYLQTPEWQQKRRAALEQAEYRCQVCNRGEHLNVHHRTY